MTNPEPSDTELQLSEGEKKLVNRMRQLMSDNGADPKVVTVYVIDGIWQVWEGQKRGRIKGIDK